MSKKTIFHCKERQPLLSVVVLTYNQVDYISNCIESILAQKTNFNVEVLIGEDESNDGTREVCKQIAKNNAYKVKLFLRSRKNLIFIDGKPTGRNNLIETLKQVKGKYIALCEGDDYWTDPYKLQKQVDFLENNLDFSLCAHNARIFNEKEGKFIGLYKNTNNDIVANFPYIVKNYFIPTASMVFRREALELPDFIKTVKSADYAMQLILAHNGKVKFFKEDMSVYRVFAKGSLSSNYNTTKSIISLLKLFKEINRFSKGKYFFVILNRRFGLLYRLFIQIIKRHANILSK